MASDDTSGKEKDQPKPVQPAAALEQAQQHAAKPIDPKAKAKPRRVDYQRAGEPYRMSAREIGGDDGK